MTSYLERLLTACLLGPLQPGEICHVEVVHESGCAFLQDGPCNCTPEITVHGSSRAYAIGPDGKPTHTQRHQ